MKQPILFIIFFLSAINVFSAYLKNVPVTLKQPDGSVIECFVTGDEFHRRVHDENNYTIVQDTASGYYVYADLRNNQLVPTPYVVGQHNPVNLALSPGNDILPSEMEAKRQSVLKSATAVIQNPTKGDFNNIVISVRFSDQNPTDIRESVYENRFNSQQSMSLKYYFNEVSNNQLNVSSYFFPEPKNDTVFEYQDSYPRAYYLPYNETTNPEGYKGGEGSLREHILLKNAIESVAGLIEASGVDFDSNDDGIIDNVILILQGNADSWGNVLWPMANIFYNDNVLIGGKKVGRYNKQLSGRFNVSVFSHEFFHSLGAPDLYRYTHTEIDPVGAWDMMAVTGTQHMTTHMKWKYGKWFDSVPEITGPGTYSLEPVSKNPYACYKIPSPKSTTEYFMVEYRKKEGLLEGTLPWHYDEGLIIYRINTESIRGNAYGPPDEIYVFRPEGDATYSGQINSAAFSADEARTFFNNYSNPSCFLSSGEPGWIDISDISVAGNEIQFTVNEINMLPEPANFVAAENNGEIVFTWEAPSNNEYTLQGYNIFLAGDSIALNESLITGTSFTIPFPGQESVYTFQLVAKYIEGESNALTLLIANPDFPLVKDSAALVTLFNHCDGPNWSDNKNWLEGPLDTWYGVTVENGRVTALRLQGLAYRKFGLKNNLPAQIGDLNALRFLDLSYNALEGNVPVEIGRLENLEELELAGNYFSGTIPVEMSNLINLRRLLLSGNALKGGIPDFLWNIKPLKELTLSDNEFTGEIPGSVNRLINLETLYLADNLLNGLLPEEIYGMRHLINLDLSGNSFSGLVLDRITSLTNLRILKLANNDFSGIMPPEIARLKNLEYLYLSHNRFSGELPDELEKLTQMAYLRLDHNQFYGAFPSGVAHLSGLVEVILSNNGFYAFPKLYSPVISGLVLSENRLTFEDIEIIKTIDFYPKFPDFMYHDQAKIGKAETRYAHPGAPYALRTYCGGKNNRYQWFKDGVAVSEVSGSPEFVVENVVPGNNGEYFCRITNGSVRDLTIESHPLTLVGKDTLIANAGYDFGADENTLVTLNGTASYHPGDGPLTYHWTAPDGISLTGADEAQPQFTAPEVFYDTEYVFTLVVNDGIGDSAPDEVVVSVRDGVNAPVADAGSDQTVDEGEQVTLDGRGSFDPQGWALTYRWTAPEGIELTDADEAQPQFTAPEVDSDTEYVFTLIVNDRTEDSAPDEVIVTVKNLPDVPVADAGPDQTVNEGEQVTLDGSGSVNPDGNVLTYRWISPDGIELTGTDEVQPQFTAPEVISDSVFIFSLIVSNGTEESSPDEMTVTVQNLPEVPVADAGPDQTVDEGELVTLNGSNSFDPGHNSLTYHWTGPNGIELMVADEMQIQFTAPEVISDSIFVFTLVVSNGAEESAPDEVVVEVRNILHPPVADAGSDQIVYAGETVTLDGSASLDMEGDELFYEWLVPEGISPDGLNESICTFIAPEYYVDTTLVFYLIVTNGNELSDTSGIEITIKTTVTASENPVESEKFYIYPNPSYGIINLKLQHIEPGTDCNLFITTASGEKVLEKQLYYSGNVKFDLSGHAPGIYFVQLINGGQVYVKKLIFGAGE